MQKAIVIVASGVELDPEARPELVKAARTILAHTVTVRTPECIGEGVAIAGTIITSLFLVRNHRMVSVASSSGGETQAVVAARDERNFLAKLEPVSLDVSSRRPIAGGKRPHFNIGPIASHGDPLFTTDASGGAPVVTVAAMTYRIKIAERFEAEPNAWRFYQQLPQGIVGGGVWNTDGQFVGLSLGRKIPFTRRARDEDNRLFALPADVVMNFAETK